MWKFSFLKNHHCICFHITRNESSMADPRGGGAMDEGPPWVPNSFIFMQFLAETLKIFNPILGVIAPPTERCKNGSHFSEVSEFSDKNICHYSKRARTCHLLCKRPGFHHSTSKTHVRDRILN